MSSSLANSKDPQPLLYPSFGKSSGQKPHEKSIKGQPSDRTQPQRDGPFFSAINLQIKEDEERDPDGKAENKDEEKESQNEQKGIKRPARRQGLLVV